jgi:hypothetical protein
MEARGCGSAKQTPEHIAPLRRAPRHTLEEGQNMSTEDDREKSREESPEWHRARAKSLRKQGFTKMAEEHEQIAQAIERRRQQTK